MEQNKLFSQYWLRKKGLKNNRKPFKVVSWRDSEALCEIEEIYFERLEDCESVLDVGAGDLRVKDKLQKAGLKAEYHTQDVGEEYSYTYSSLEQVQRKYDAIVCLDVIEHMALLEGIKLIEKMISLLNPEGFIILQTPNARCIRNPLAWDMTHQHLYNLPDLWVLFTSSDFSVEGYRIVFKDDRGFLGSIYSLIGKFIITKLIGADYADNIALIAKREGSVR